MYTVKPLYEGHYWDHNNMSCSCMHGSIQRVQFNVHICEGLQINEWYYNHDQCMIICLHVGFKVFCILEAFNSVCI